MIQFKTIHLFNCDHLYDLETVRNLLNVVKSDLPFELHMESHYFNLQDMTRFSEEIRTMDMDYAVFVVHANESRLSINEQNAGIGYGRVFKELLLKTGGKVLVVIGGDSNYRRGEETSTVISDWARYKVSSQFLPQSMNGRKSFVFSWAKKHNPIHVYATKHFFKDEGVEFEIENYMPKPKPPRVEYGGTRSQEGQIFSHERTGYQIEDPPYGLQRGSPLVSPPRRDNICLNIIRKNPRYVAVLFILLIITIIIILATALPAGSDDNNNNNEKNFSTTNV